MVVNNTTDLTGRRKLSPAITAGIALSAVLHVGLVVYLYHRNFELRPYEAPAPKDPFEVLVWKPKPEPKPEVPPKASQPPTASRLPVREPAPSPTPAPDPAPFEPYVGEPAPMGPPPVIGQVDPGPPTPPAPVATPAPPRPSVIVRPNWISRPTAEQFARYYPQRALEDEQEGQAVLSCRVTASGQVTACTIVGESPSRAGFGEAALKLARFFRMSPLTKDGQPVEGGSVRVPISFELGD